MEKHSLYKELVDLGIVKPEMVKPYYPRVWDREDVGALKCMHSGVIFLERIDHLGDSYYEGKEGLTYWNKEGRDAALRETWADDSRRAAQISPMLVNKRYLDVGSGLGGILDLLKPVAKYVHAVEPQKDAMNNLRELGYEVYASTEELVSSGNEYDVITLFHVLEHIPNHTETLKQLYKALAPGGKIIIEVPHAGDALLNTYDLESFRKFTLWSEHLILHTRKSLEVFLAAAGFQQITVTGFQRFPLANHLMWLKDGKPGGHVKMPQLRDSALEDAYSKMLSRIDQNDTIIAIATK
jgi:2-polyprenyl-3-methyl-5-hydroxy-6-metoxy-1,4-benzoquinol methylase